MPFRVYLLIVLTLLPCHLSSDKDASRFLPVAAATPAGGSAIESLQCVTASDIQALQRAAQGKDSPRITMWGAFAGPPREEFSRCHSEGLAVSVRQNVVVSTCMGDDATRQGRAAHILVHDLLNGALGQERQVRDHYSVLLYKRDRGTPRFEQGGSIPEQMLNSPDQTFTHPSATQIVENVFPVGFTVRRGQYGPAHIRFYSLSDTGALQREPRWQSMVVNDHIGALGWGQVAAVDYLVGCTWNCARFLLWRGGPAGRWLFVKASRFRSLIVNDGIDQVHHNYNSLYFTRTCIGDRPLFFASADHWVDLWEILHITAPDRLRLRKLVSFSFGGTPRNLFHEGVSFFKSEGKLSMLAAPYDFAPGAGCPDAVCMPAVVQVDFLSNVAVP